MFQRGEIIDNTYQIVCEIGNGGTGIVFKAYHLRLKKYVVIKKIKDNFISRVNVRLEVDILKKLHHRYLPQVYDFVQRGTEVYTIIDYIEGYDLEYYMEQGYVVSEGDIIRWLKQLCDVLDYLHKQNPPILHSDIKPGNIMITNDGNVCLIDFNISLDEQTGNGISGLSQHYAAPEQVEKAMAVSNHKDSSYIILDARMDIYSLAATFYYILSGVRPTFQYQEIYPLTGMEIPYSYGLLSTIQKAMSYHREDRYQSAEEMLKALTNLKKKDTKYRVCQTLKIGSFAIYALLMSMGILLCVRGNNLNRLNAYREDYSLLIKMIESGNYVKATTKGIDILNNEKYRNILIDNDYDSMISYMIGDCYYYEENYDGAVKYYGNAYVKNQSSSEEKYFRDYAIALVKQDSRNIQTAEMILEKAKKYNGFSSGVKVVEAQIMYADKKIEDAETIVKEIINGDATQDDKFRAYMIWADIYGERNEIDNEIKVREKAYEIDRNNKDNMRNLANLYVKKLDSYADYRMQGVDTLCRKAENIYEELIETAYPVLEDQINYSIICRLTNETTKLNRAKEILQNAMNKYTEDYRIDMNLAYIYRQLGENSKAILYCRQAVSKYNKSLDTSGCDYEKIYDLKKELGE